MRLPSPDHCAAQGLDVRRWCEEGLVDVLVAGNPGGSEAETNYSFAPMLELAAGTGTRVLGSQYARLGSDRLDAAPAAMVRGAACNAWAEGVDGLYLDMWFGIWP